MVLRASIWCLKVEIVLSCNLFLANVGLSYSAVKNKPFKQYCCSFNGSTLWSLHDNECSEICIAWRKALKVIWNLPYATHKRILSLLCGSTLFHVQLKARFVKFIHRALNHNNSVIKSVTKYACNNSMSVCGRNLE